MNFKKRSNSFPKTNRFEHGSRQQAAPENPTFSGIDLFPVAVFIMGTVSCYTTAVGLHPMLDNWILSYAMAFALSVFMVAIALKIPRAYEEGTQGKMIAGYTFVALFSVLLNFNAIYGVFSSEKLLYEELKANKSELAAIHVRAQEALASHFDATKLEKDLAEAEGLLKEETSNTMDPGYGQKARRIAQEQVIPLRAALATARARYQPALQRMDSLVTGAQTTIDAALQSGKISNYRQAVDKSIDAYAWVGESTRNLVGAERFDYQPLAFQHRDVGNLNHSLWTLMNVFGLEGRQASSVLVSLLLAVLIDFIVLFVLVLINRPPKRPAFDPKTLMEEASSQHSNPFVRSQPVRKTGNPGIYAHRQAPISRESEPAITPAPAPLPPRPEKVVKEEATPEKDGEDPEMEHLEAQARKHGALFHKLYKQQEAVEKAHSSVSES